MNLQRREEIRMMIADENTEDPQALTDCRNALTEAFAHIDTLEQTAAERVIRGGSRGPTPDYTGEGSAWVPPVEARAVASEECPRVEQTVLHAPGASRGNCFLASVAGLLKLPIDAIPQLAATENESWQEQFNGWLRQFGLAWFPMAGDDLASECQQYGISGLWSEISGKSPRFEGGHSCVAKDGELAWDPHPSQSGLERPIWWHGVFVALRPWELASRAIPSDRVLVPEPTVRQWIDEVLYVAREDPEPHATMRAATRWFREHSHTISPDRVLGEMDSLCREIASLSLEIRKIEESGYPDDAHHYVKINDRRHAALVELDALRANQGGAAT